MLIQPPCCLAGDASLLPAALHPEQGSQAHILRAEVFRLLQASGDLLFDLSGGLTLYGDEDVLDIFPQAP